MHITSITSNHKDMTKVKKDFETIYGGENTTLDKVILKIDELYAQNNISLCRQLNKALIEFKISVKGKIDVFENNIYNT